ncbi:MAG: hypothetical protein HKN36_03755 [Hellea sp.]|nr:hypothetical protein [Hellea sp.]
MRLAALSMSAVLLSGCSWLGGITSPSKSHQKAPYAYASAAQGQGGMQGAHNPCIVYSPVQPAPQGCDPSMVTVANGHQNYGGTQSPTYTTGGYGSHAGNAQQMGHHRNAGPKLKKPKLRGSLSLGTEKSVSGSLLDFQIPGVSPVLAYNPTPFIEGRTVDNGDSITTTTYTSALEGIEAPTLSFDDVHKSPVAVKAGLEYIVSPKFTMFANGGYSHTTGSDGARASVVSTLLRTVSDQPVDDMGAPTGPPLVNTSFIPNQNVANIFYDFSDQRQFDVEIGARHYLAPVYRTSGYKTLTPFVGASVGVSHLNDVTYKTNQNQLFLEQAFEDDQYNYYDVPTPGTVTTLYDKEWLVNGGLQAGLEMQVTPSTALAFETGVKVYQGRDYSTGDSGDMNVSVPLTLRGSFNF